jgi:UDP-N-acetylmuramoylalanine--D-glutamate ligase
MGLWLAEAPRERVVCITGTKGKSTTTAIVGTLLRGMGVRCFIGGNLGSPPWNPDVPRDVDYWVIEVSSYQALDVVVGPAIVVVTSLSEDHLTWHRSDPEQYYSDKLSLCTKPGVRTVIANGADKTLRARASMLGQAVSWVDDLPGAWAENLGLRGLHNLRNAEIARIAVLELGIEGAADATVLGQAASNYEPLPSRLSWIGNVAGVDFIDDSLSTNVLPTLAALEAFNGRRIALLVGGHERGIDYAPLAEALALRNPDVLVVTMPDNGPRIATAVKSVHGAPDVIECDNIQAATATAFEWARPDGVVLLSPAAPSFGRHTNYQGRAAAFLAAMRALVIDGEN